MQDCYHCNESKIQPTLQDMVMTKTHWGKSLRCYKQNELSYWLQIPSLSFVFSGYCWEEDRKGNLPSLLFGIKR